MCDSAHSKSYSAGLTAVNTVSQSYAPGRTSPVLVHDYDDPVPEGRGLLWGWPFPDPWLQPGLGERRFNDLETGIPLLRLLIERINQMVMDFAAAAAGRVDHIDLRNMLSTVVAGDAYKDWWANGLHPTGDGFSAIAAQVRRGAATGVTWTDRSRESADDASEQADRACKSAGLRDSGSDRADGYADRPRALTDRAGASQDRRHA